MSRVKRDMYKRKLEKLLRTAEDEKFFTMIWSIQMVQGGFPHKAAPFFRFPDEAITEKISDNYYIYPWMLETLSNELLCVKKAFVGRKGRVRHLNCGEFDVLAILVNILREIENADDGLALDRVGILQELHRIAQRQFEWQRGFFSYVHLLRSYYIFCGPLGGEYFQQQNGFSIDDFGFVSFAIRASYLDKPAMLRDISMKDIGVDQDISRAIIDLISLPIAKARVLAKESRAAHIHTAYRPSIFRQYPCIAFPETNKIYAPCSDLINLRSTSGLFYDIISGGGRIRDEVGHRFEEYCYRILSPQLPEMVIQSEKYKYNGNVIDTPDIRVCRSGSLEVIFECKAARMAYAARFAENPLAEARRGYDELAKGILQIWRYCSHVRQGYAVERLSNETRGIVLTLDTWLSMSSVMRSTVIENAHALANEMREDINDNDRIPVSFCSIDDLESTLAMSTSESFIHTIRSYTNDEYKGWELSSVHSEIFPEVNSARDNPLLDQISEYVPWVGRLREMEEKLGRKNT